MTMQNKRIHVLHIIGWIIGGLIMAVIFAFLFGYFVMLLWNWIMPALFGINVVTYWQAFGLVLLVRLLIGNFGGPRKSKRKQYIGPHFLHHYHERVDNESSERWKHYDSFWKEEGEKAFEDYVSRKKTQSEENEINKKM